MPPAQTPLDRHSLIALERWLQLLGAEKSIADPCSWEWLRPQWRARIFLEKEELRVVWDSNGVKSQICFPYGLPRGDVEAVMIEGP